MGTTIKLNYDEGTEKEQQYHMQMMMNFAQVENKVKVKCKS